MSETVHYRGKLYRVDKLENETIEDQCKRLLNNRELDKFYSSYKEMLLEECYDEYIEHDEIIYKVSKTSLDSDEDIYRINMNIDGTMDFEVKYYNGGCGFSEAIEEALEKYSKKETFGLNND